MNKSMVFSICAFIMLACLLGTTIFKKMTKGRTNKLFFTELIVCSCTAFFNILFYLSILYLPMNLFTIVLANIFKYLYFFFNSLAIPIAFIYILSSIGILYIFEKNDFFKIIFLIFVAVPFCIILDNIFSHRLFSITKALGYTTFFFENTFFIINFAYMTIILVFLIVYRKFLSRSKIIVGFTMYPIYLLTLIYQLRNNSVDFSIFLYAITCYLVMTTSQRPELLIDPSTGVWSESSFYQECKKDYLLNRPSSLVLVKIQNYKNLITYLGQNNYLAMIKAMTARFSLFLSYFKQQNSLYYLDDCTFAVLMENAPEQYLSLIAGEINYELSNEFSFREFRIHLKPCICVATLPVDFPNYDSFSYFTKTFYKILPAEENVVYVKDIVNSQDFKVRNEIGEILNEAIKEKHFEVFYQPIYGVKEEKYICAEALIRLKDPKYGYILPGIFLSHAEENGLIYEIGDFVLEEVCKFIGSKDFEQLGLQYIEINLSQTQCVEENFVSKFLETLNKYNISHDKIRLEITESAVISNPVLIESNIKQLHSAGIHFALDNYGTGYSNIRTVTQLPFSVVKLDKTFVENIHEETMWIVVQDTIFMLKKLNKEILVEGIENEESAKIFKELKCDLMQGCEYIQGFYFSEPVPKEEFIKRLKSQKHIAQ